MGVNITTTRAFFPYAASLVLLALVNAEYRFLWVDIGSSRSLSYAQLLIRSKLREKIGDGTLEHLPPKPLGEG